MAGGMTTGKRIAFWIVLVAMPLLLLGACEGAARLLVRTQIAEDPKVNLVEVPSFFETRSIGGREFVEISHPEAYGGRRTRFLAAKPPRELRIFCLGGSASAGWPHPPSEIYSVYLQRALAAALPQRRPHVINASAHAYAAYRVRLIFDNVVEHDPEILILYSGNNEFLERRTYLRDFGLGPALGAANRLVLFRLLRREFTEWMAPENVLSGSRREDAYAGLRSKLAQVPIDLREDPEQFRQVQEHYAATIEGMVRDAGERQVAMVLVTVPVNLRDWHPNVSHNRLQGEARARFEALFDEGRGALLRGDPDEAAARFREALALEPIHAETHYQLARALEAGGRFEEAYASYALARDLDHNPFRAIGAFNTILRDLASRYDHVVLADAEAAFAAASAPRAPGYDLFLDYVHPNQQGNLVLARTVFEALTRSGMLGEGPRTAPFHYVPAEGPDGGAYDEASDLRLHRTLLALFTTMHQYEAMVDEARLVQRLDPEAESVTDPILGIFPRYLELEERRLRGLPVAPDALARAREDVRRFYARELSAVPEAG